MVRSMGASSSQIQVPSAQEAVAGRDKGKKNKKRKAKIGSIETSEDLKGPTDNDFEGAQVLLRLREEQPQSSEAPYNDDLAASQQLIAENFPIDASIPNGSNLVAVSPLKAGNRKKHGKNTKKREGNSRVSSITKKDHDEDGDRQLPSTPPGQIIHSSPPPYLPPISQSSHALDDIPTDDEDITAYMQEYEENKISPRPAITEHDIYGLSQRPTDTAVDEEYETGIYPPNRQSRHVHLSARTSGKSKKRQRRSGPSESQLGEIQYTAQNGTDIDMPIDPELHSISALPPSVDLSHLDNRVGHASQRKKKKVMDTASAPSSERRPTEDMRNTPNGKAPYYRPHTTVQNEENMLDTVLPGLEDLQRRASRELGTPSMEDIAYRSLEFLSDGPSRDQIAQQNQNSSSSKVKGTVRSKRNAAGEARMGSQGDHFGNRGPYTPVEAAKLDRFRDVYCEANNMSVGQFNNHIQSSMRGNPAATEIFNEIHELLPYRPHVSLQKFCRRRYHNFQRGAWSAGEDKVLKQAAAEKGNNWKAVGDIVGRMAEDCRDRYRNYIHNSENRNREQWTHEEVHLFCDAILDCMRATKEDRRQTRIEKYGEDAPHSDSDSDQEEQDMKLVNWQAVSDRMGGTRSRLQCSFKWSQLKTKQRKEMLQRHRDEREFDERRHKTKNPWRARRASAKVANMKTGDQYALLRALADCRAPGEGNIPWKSIGDDGVRAMWNSTDKKTAWSKFKLHVPGAATMDYHDVANELISRILASGGAGVDERWDPAVHGDVSAKSSKKGKGKGRPGEDEGEISQQEQKKTRRRKQSDHKKSEQFGRETDEEEAADSTNERQDVNGIHALPRAGEAKMVVDPNEKGASATDDEEEQPADDGAIEEDDEADSLFDEPINGEEDLPVGEDGVSEDLARRVHRLRDA